MKYRWPEAKSITFTPDPLKVLMNLTAKIGKYPS
jgi:hypothetical protein